MTQEGSLSSEQKIIMCDYMQWMHCANLQAEDVFSLSGKITTIMGIH